jgi:UDP-glucose 4-epimerase
MASVLVTGAAGFVGSHTVEALLAAGHHVTGIDNLRTGSEGNLGAVAGHPAWRFIRQDILDADDFRHAVRAAKPEIILHLAALVSLPESIADPRLHFDLNVRAVHIVVDAAAMAGVRRMIFASSAAVYGESDALPFDEESPTRPLNPYGEAKLAGESLVLGQGRARGSDAVCLRYFNVYGPRQPGDSPYSGVVSRFLDRLQAGRPPVIYGDGMQTRDFIHVRDVSRANAMAVGAPAPLTGVFNICSGRECAVGDLAALMMQEFMSPSAPVFEAARPGEARRSAGNGARAKAVLGFSAGIAMAAGLGELKGISIAY